MTRATSNQTRVRLRRWIAAILGLALIISVIAVGESPAIAAKNGRLSGKITWDTADGMPAAGVVVEVYLRYDDPQWYADTESQTATAKTGADGTYLIESLEIGSYLVVAIPPTGDAHAVAFEARVAVTADTESLDLTLAMPSVVSGKVVSQSGVPVPAAIVYFTVLDTGGRLSWYARTDSDGDYVFDSLPAGEYSVRAVSNDYEDAQTTVGIGTTHIVDNFTITMPSHASISGRVTSAADLAQGIEGIVVTRNGASTTTAADGTWTLKENQTGVGSLAFSDPEQRYLPQWYSDASGVPLAVVVHRAEQATGYDALLVPAATISGTVTGFGDGIGVANVSVSVTAPGTEWSGRTVVTDSAGRYAVKGLYAGNYTVQFLPPGSQFVRKTTKNLMVPRGGTITANAVLDRTSGIVGTVTFEGSGPSSLSSVRLRMNDDKTVRPDANGNFSFSGLAAGSYSFEVIPDDDVTYADRWYENGSDYQSATRIAVHLNEPSVHVNVVVPLRKQPKTTRVSGADRYAVAVNVSRQAYPGGAPVVYIATGETYPDALSAGAAAVVQGGPLLLTARSTLPSEVKAEIQRLKPARIVVVGGPNSVSPAVLTILKGMQPKTVRVDGADRFAVSRSLALDVFGDSGADSIYVATGLNFPDALAAGGAAGSQGAPVLLVNGQAETLDAATESVLRNLDPGRIYIAGGPASVSPGVAAALATYGTVERLGGADRYEASVAINLSAYASSADAYLVTGSNFPDALSGSAWAGHVGAPLYVSRPDCVPQVTLDAITQQGARKVTLIGGPSSLSAAVLALRPCD